MSKDIKSHEKFMRECFRLAKKGRGHTHPNPLVGAVIVKEGKIISQGYHSAFGKPHAEIEAIKNCKEETTNASLYVNLEPCCHSGKTPPCTNAIITKKFKEVIIANKDPNKNVAGKGVKALQNAGIKVTSRILEKEGKELNKHFFKWISTATPYVTIKVAMTANGMIAGPEGTPIKITGEEADKEVHSLRQENQAILVGINTVINDNPRLTCRIEGETKDPLRVIVDTTLRIPDTSKVTNNDNYLLATTRSANNERIKQFKKENIWISPTTKKVDMKELLKELGKRNIASLLIEGGAKIIHTCIEEGLVDEVILIKSPTQIPNGIRGIKQEKKMNLEDITVHMLGKDQMIQGKVKAYTNQ